MLHLLQMRRSFAGITAVGVCALSKCATSQSPGRTCMVLTISNENSQDKPTERRGLWETETVPYRPNSPMSLTKVRCACVSVLLRASVATRALLDISFPQGVAMLLGDRCRTGLDPLPTTAAFLSKRVEQCGLAVE